MHELSIAESIVRIALETAGNRRVAKVEVKVGHLRQVVPSALEFSFQLVTEGTLLDGAELEIEHVPVEVSCTACGRRTPCDGFPLACARCGSLGVEVVKGEELLVDSLELDEPESGLDGSNASLASVGEGRHGV